MKGYIMTSVLKGWYIARLAWSDHYDRPYYTTNLSAVSNFADGGERRVLNTTSGRVQADGCPGGRVYFGEGQEDYQNAAKFAFINCDENYTGSSSLMSEEQMKSAMGRLSQKSQQPAEQPLADTPS